MEPTIQQIAQSSPVAKEVFKVLEKRQRFRKRSDISRIYREIKSTHMSTDPKEVLNVFKELQSLGVGSIVIGRKNNPNRFIWKYNLKEVAKAAKNKDVSLNNLDTFKEGPSKAETINTASKTVFKSSTVSKTYPVIQITLRLPVDTRMEDIKAYLDLAKSLQK